MELRLFDTHSHFNDEMFASDLEEVMGRMHSAGIGTIVVGTDKDMSEKAVSLSEKHENMWATVGLHPTDNVEEIFDESFYENLAKSEKVVAVGECGLDYYRLDNTQDRNEVIAKQKEKFVQQIKFANKINKPLMLHVRDIPGRVGAYEDALEILEEHAEVLGNVHFFTGSIEIAEQFNKMNYTVSFPGVVTFAKDLEEVVKSVPSDMYMIETDAPYAAPVPHRGKRNEPLYVQDTAKKIAEIRGISEDQVAEETLATAKRLFKI